MSVCTTCLKPGLPADGLHDCPGLGDIRLTRQLGHGLRVDTAPARARMALNVLADHGYGLAMQGDDHINIADQVLYQVVGYEPESAALILELVEDRRANPAHIVRSLPERELHDTIRHLARVDPVWFRATAQAMDRIDQGANTRAAFGDNPPAQESGGVVGAYDAHMGETEQGYRWQRNHAARLEEDREALVTLARVRELRDSWLLMTLEPGQVRRLLDEITRVLDGSKEAGTDEPPPGFVPAAVPKHIPRTGDPADTLVVEPYRNDWGESACAFRCWGTSTCDGRLPLDHYSQESAERARDRHVAEEHTTEEQPMPAAKPTCTATIDGPHVLGGGPVHCTREAGHPENHVGPKRGADGKALKETWQREHGNKRTAHHVEELRPVSPVACSAYRPSADPVDSGLCASCGMFDYKHREPS